MIYFLAAFGLSYVIGLSKITLPLRQWLGFNDKAFFRRWLADFMECPACTGFHIGFWAGWFGFVQIGGVGKIPTAVVVALATCAVNLFLTQLLDTFDEYKRRGRTEN